MGLRNPTPDEIKILDFLISQVKDFAISKEWSINLLVADMNDDMASLQLFPSGLQSVDRSFGAQASDCQFTDEDGVEVIASLYLDQFGDLYELDIWKTNFEKLIRIPTDINKLRKL